MSRLLRCLFVAILFCGSFVQNVYAQTEELFVTAQRFKVDINKTLSNITLIERPQIEASGASDLPSLLALTPAIAISRAGGSGQQTSAFLRGTESDHFLLMIDGVRVASATSGAAALNLVPLESIERIEIVRGPRSSLYGSEALGGVVHIMTRSSDGGGFGSLEAGSNQTFSARGGFQHRNQDTQFGITVGATTSDGIDALIGSDPDDDGHENISINANIDHQFSNALQFNGSVFHSSGDQEYDDAFDATAKPSNEFSQQAISAGLTYSASEYWQLAITVAQSKDELDVSSNFPDFFNTKTGQLNLSATRQQGENALMLGYDYRDEKLDSQTSYQESSRDNQALYINYLRNQGAHQFSISVRNDDNQAFGSETTGNVAYGVAFSNGLKATLAAGTAYKAPSFNDLYFPDFPPFFFANPDLQPETATNIELTLSGGINSSRWQASVFRNEISDLISFAGVTSENIDEVEITGLELSASTRLADWTFNGNATFLDHENKQTGEALLRRPERTLNLTASRQWQDWQFNLEASYNNPRTDIDFSTFPAAIVELDEIWLLNAGLSYSINDRFSIYAKLNNLGDETYQTILGYNSPGVEGLIGVRFR